MSLDKEAMHDPQQKVTSAQRKKTKTLQGSEGAEEEGRRAPRTFYSEKEGATSDTGDVLQLKPFMNKVKI